jgi:hypothetical protein
MLLLWFLRNLVAVQRHNGFNYAIAVTHLQFDGCIPDVPLGVRLLANLAASVEAVSGKEGLAKTPVILHLSQSQLDDIGTLQAHQFGGWVRSVWIITELWIR